MYYLNEIRFSDGSIKEYVIDEEDDNALYDNDCKFIPAWRVNILTEDWTFLNQYGCDISVNHIISNQTIRRVGDTEYVNKKAEHLKQYNQRG